VAAAGRLDRKSPEDLVERTSFSMEGARAAASKLIERGATGIVCASDVLALGTVRAARRLGLRVPNDVSVVGYDDSAFMNCTDPPLTTVRQPIEAIGQAAVDLLVSQIEGVGVTPDELLFEPELVVRGSTAPAPR
jgi:DNA-binding LacI/PurR family transcriptional regulator